MTTCSKRSQQPAHAARRHVLHGRLQCADEFETAVAFLPEFRLRSRLQRLEVSVHLRRSRRSHRTFPSFLTFTSRSSWTEALEIRAVLADLGTSAKKTSSNPATRVFVAEAATNGNFAWRFILHQWQKRTANSTCARVESFTAQNRCMDAGASSTRRASGSTATIVTCTGLPSAASAAIDATTAGRGAERRRRARCGRRRRPRRFTDARGAAPRTRPRRSRLARRRGSWRFADCIVVTTSSRRGGRPIGRLVPAQCARTISFA